MVKDLVSRRYIFTTAVILIVVGIGENNNPKNTVKTDYQLTPLAESTFFVAHQSSSTKTTTISVMHFLLMPTEGVEESSNVCIHCLQFISVDEFLIDKTKQMGALSKVIDAL